MRGKGWSLRKRRAKAGAFGRGEAKAGAFAYVGGKRRGKGWSLRLLGGEERQRLEPSLTRGEEEGQRLEPSLTLGVTAKKPLAMFYPTNRSGIGLTGFLKLNASPPANYFSERLRHSRCAAASIDLVAGHGFYGGYASLR